jgi:hypothetical protein
VVPEGMSQLLNFKERRDRRAHAASITILIIVRMAQSLLFNRL